MGGQPSRHLLAKGVAGLAEIVARQAAAKIEVMRRHFFTRVSHPAHRQRIQMHAAKMPRRLVLLGVADGTEDMLGFQRYLAQRRAAEGNGRGCEIGPVSRATVVLRAK